MENYLENPKIEILEAKAKYEAWFSEQMKSLEFHSAAAESLERHEAIADEMEREVKKEIDFLFWALDNKLFETMLFLKKGLIDEGLQSNAEALLVIEKIKSLI